MAQGYFKDDMEIVGQVYFDNLAMRSFFQHLKNDCFDETRLICKMHDIVQDFAQFLTKNECLIIETNDIEVPKIKSVHERTRHLMIFGEKNSPFPVSVYKLKKLRSLLLRFPSHEFESGELLLDLFGQLTCLRSLDLSRPIFGVSSIHRLPNEVGQLIHLRLLDLSWNTELTKLPESLCHLYNLQTLNIRWCLDLKELPHGMGKLINLRHFDNLGTASLTFMPKCLGRLTSLRTFERLVVGGISNDGEAMTLGDLRQLNNLRGTLYIRGLGSVKDVQEATNAQLLNKKHLLKLMLRFDGQITDTDRIDDLLLEALQPPLDLEILYIDEYMVLAIWPSWLIQLTRLRELRLESFKNIEQLPPLGILPALQVLYIKNMPKVNKVGLEFLGIGTPPFSSSSPAFPQLQVLRFDDMANWEEWDYEITTGTVHHSTSNTNTSTFMVMPLLKSLRFFACHKLKDQEKIRQDLVKASTTSLLMDLLSATVTTIDSQSI
ncbi:putative disease resistance RPP13-like protein 1 isoform X2 [Carica papaya]|uniref:putative disease resistance RPP13-like protein 1 isoform X2 n=1 Tax=Carica papaya TaxID=3649 RepID=UPI000B8CEE2F|nr:putative disease resistance RPP13-like protein 1 isoform X2 [Carica papaya]